MAVFSLLITLLPLPFLYVDVVCTSQRMLCASVRMSMHLLFFIMEAHDSFLWGMNWIFICNNSLIAMYIGCAITQAVSCQAVTTEAWVRSQVSPCEIGDTQIGNWIGFSPNYLVYPSHYHSTNALYSSLCTCCSYQKYKWAGPMRGRGSQCKLVGSSSVEWGLGSVYVAYVFIFYGSIIFCHLYRVTLSDQVQVILQLRVRCSVKTFSWSALAGGPNKFFTGTQTHFW